MPKKYLILLIVGLILIVSGIFYVWQNKAVVSNLNPVPKPTSVSQPAVVLTDSYKGTVVSFNTSLIAISTGKTFNIAGTKDFQGVTYGSLEQGNAVTVPSSRSDLAVGKLVFVVTLKDTNIVKSIYIFR